MTQIEHVATFVAHTRYEDISEEARRALKIRVLDALGCAIGALDGEPMVMVRALLDDFGGRLLATLIGGTRTAPDRAAFYNSGLRRSRGHNSKESLWPRSNIALDPLPPRAAPRRVS